MARFKPAGSKKPKPAKSTKGWIPCVVIIVMGFAIVFLLFYLLLQSNPK